LTKEHFSDEGELMAFLKDVEDNLHDPNRGETIGLALIMVATSAHKKLKEQIDPIYLRFFSKQKADLPLASIFIC